MRFFQIKETLTPSTKEEFHQSGIPYVAILSFGEWRENSSIFDMVIDMELETEDQRETKAVVNSDSLTGCFSIPDREQITKRHFFSFALDEKGIVLIDDSGYASALVEEVRRTRKWRLPSLERFIYDLLEQIIHRDLKLLGRLEHQLGETENHILKTQVDDYPPELNQIRGDLIDLRVHYEQLIDLAQELQENENGFFREENLRYFNMFTERVIRLQATVTGQREYVTQLRDLIQSQLDERQNRIMTVLTVITSIFLPLSLIAGWYGMNFRYMPELDWRWSYPAVLVVSVLIVVFCLVLFKKKKWM